ncbi:prolyl oligopeptidase family serine peptidase [Streptosporangium subroseum]|uniref:alpha/beta hydrolase family protein n=1 Tax=Streptosporangium subroseum TaxID=106412 RepID=UPI00341A7F91
MHPPTDLTDVRLDGQDSLVTRLLGGPPSELRQEAAQASPVSHVSPKAPPFLLVHGADDRVLPPVHSERLHTLLLEAGARSSFIPVEGAGHTFTGYADIAGLIATSVAFLAQELR